MDERALCERLITYDTSTPDGLRAAAGFVKGCLEAGDVEVVAHDHRGLPVIAADVGSDGAGRPWCSTVTWTSCPGARASSSPASRAIASTAAVPTT